MRDVLGVADLFVLRHGRRVGLVDAVRGGEAAAQDLGALGSGPQLLGAAAPRDPSLPAADARHAAGAAQPLLAGKQSPGSIRAGVRNGNDVAVFVIVRHFIVFLELVVIQGNLDRRENVFFQKNAFVFLKKIFFLFWMKIFFFLF